MTHFSVNKRTAKHSVVASNNDGADGLVVVDLVERDAEVLHHLVAQRVRLRSRTRQRYQSNLRLLVRAAFLDLRIELWVNEIEMYWYFQLLYFTFRWVIVEAADAVELQRIEWLAACSKQPDARRVRDRIDDITSSNWLEGIKIYA